MKSFRSCLLLLLVGATTSFAADDMWLELARGVLDEASKDGRADAVATLLSSFVGGAAQGKGGPAADVLQGLMSGQGLQGLATLLPALLTPGHEHSDDEATEDTAGHAAHDEATALLLSYLGTLWDKVKESDLVRAVWRDSGLEKFIAVWASEAGRFNPERLLESLRNPTFRRTWLSSVTSSMAQWIYHLNNPDTQQRYVSSAVSAINGLLQTQGLNERLESGRPLGEALPPLVDSLILRQLGLKVESAAYLKPVVDYFHESLKIGGGSVAGLSAREIEDRLSDTINTEIVDSILRVWDGHKFAQDRHTCDRQVLCSLNRPPRDLSQPLRPGVTKLASLVSAWFLSGHTGTPFLTLYSAATSGSYNCQDLYPADCRSWHEHDTQYTTDFEHNEL